jgi:hypothetical protein
LSGYTLGDAMRIHDLAIWNWLAGLHVDYGTAGGLFTSEKNDVSIIGTFASPDRAFAAVVNTLVKNGWISEADANSKLRGDDIATLPLPVVTIMPGDPALDPELRHVPIPLLSPTNMLDANNRQYIFPHPAHYRRDYTITFWSHRQYTATHIFGWIANQFGAFGCADNERLISVVHPEPFGTVSQSLRQVSFSDRSDLEGEAPRYIRRDLMVNLRMWVLKAPVAIWGTQQPDPIVP